MNSVRCVLLVDDNEADNFFHRLAIEETGLAGEIVAAETGAEALELLATAKIEPELIFLDVNLPGMSGWEFLEAYRRLSAELSRAEVVFLTTSSAPEDRQRARSLGARGGLRCKPLTAEGFRRVVSDYRAGWPPTQT